MNKYLTRNHGKDNKRSEISAESFTQTRDTILCKLADSQRGQIYLI